MAIYLVQNQWGGNTAPWHPGGTWVLGCRANQNVVAMDVRSNDGGKTLTGTMTYFDEGPIGFKATQVAGCNYTVENQWGGKNAPWHPGGNWIMGYREDQYVVAMKVNMTDSGDLEGTITYKGEGPIAFKGMLVAGCSYSVENQWGGKRAAWNPGGTFVLGTRKDQKPIAFDIMSNNDGKTFTGTMTYYGEGPIGFKATQVGGNVYKVENQWGGKNAAWNPAGQFVIGCRVNQRVVAMKVTSTDNGDHFTGEMTYAGEGPIGFKAVLSELVTAGVKS